MYCQGWQFQLEGILEDKKESFEKEEGMVSRSDGDGDWEGGGE